MEGRDLGRIGLMSKRYTQELKEHAVRTVLECEKDYKTRYGTVKAVANKVDIGNESLRGCSGHERAPNSAPRSSAQEGVATARQDRPQCPVTRLTGAVRSSRARPSLRVAVRRRAGPPALWPRPRRLRTPAATPTAATTQTATVGRVPSRAAGVRDVRSGRVAVISSAVNSPVRSTTSPSGRMMPLTPTVETWTVARPCSTARKRDIASCWVDSWEYPKEALFVGMMMSSPPPTTPSRIRPA